VKKVIMIVISVYLSLIVFMPKEQLIYTLLNTASKDLINFEIEDMSDFGLYEDVKNMLVIYDKMKIAKIEDTKLFPFLLYNKLYFQNIQPQGSFKNMLNIVVIDASATYTPINPFKVFINATTTLGDMSGEFDIKTSKIKLFLKPNDKFKRFKYKRYFKKQKGGYVYESIIR